MKDFAYQRLPVRLALRFLDLSSCGCTVQSPSRLALAELLGTYRERISTLLSGLMDRRLPKSSYRRIELPDTAGLRIAAGEPARISDLPIPPDGQAPCTEDDGTGR